MTLTRFVLSAVLLLCVMLLMRYAKELGTGWELALIVVLAGGGYLIKLYFGKPAAPGAPRSPLAERLKANYGVLVLAVLCFGLAMLVLAYGQRPQFGYNQDYPFLAFAAVMLSAGAGAYFLWRGLHRLLR